ncbi:MAG: ABC transporter ATP-binding protein [Myxococcales bacterium]|nr:ABC transporter ATP-binding protein [Myxococcales bacterium]
MSGAVEIRGLRRSFGPVQALCGVDLDVPEGCTFGLVGPNGAGKTTLFSILAGFIRPSGGQVRVLGRPPDELPPGTLAVLPQDASFRRQVPVRSQLELFAKLQGLAPEAARRDVERVLELCDLREIANRAPDVLSHGMRKRVAIAQAFLGEPRMVILDEPIAGLDPAQARRIRTLIQAEAGKRTFVISSHVMADIETLCSRVAIIDKGRITAQPEVADLTRRGGVVVFTLEAAPPPELAAAFQALPAVAEVEAKSVERKLQISVRAGTDLDAACGDFLRVLVERRVAFVAMQKGTSLEDAVIEATEKPAK